MKDKKNKAYITAKELGKFIKNLENKYSLQVDSIIDEYNELIGYQITLNDDKGNEIIINNRKKP